MKANKSDFKFQNETTMQCKTTIYSATSFWKYNVKQNICRSRHRRCSIKKLLLKIFAIFTGKHLKPCNFVKKRLQHKYFPVNIAKFLRAPILKNICELLPQHLFLIKTRDAFASAKLFIKKALIGQVLFKKNCWCDGPRFRDQGSNSFYF